MLVKDLGIVLGVRKSGETSVIVNFLAREAGKVRFIIKGALASKHPSRGTLEPGNSLEVLYYDKPDRTLYYVKETALRFAPTGRRDSLTAMAALLAGLELLDQVCYPGSADAHILDLAVEYSSTPPGPEPLFTFLAFEIKLLEALGVSPEVSHCAHCHRAMPSGHYVPAEGASFCGEHGREREGALRLSAEVRNLMEVCVTEPMSELAILDVSRAARKDLGRIIHWTYTHHVHGYRLPNSLSLLQ